MRQIWMNCFICVSLALVVFSSASPADDWPQWGGRNRDFKSTTTGLAHSWPATGPKRLWSRQLGEGHSAIVSDGTRLYTQYSQGEQEFVIALDANSGKTAWQHRYDAPTAGMDYEGGKGPHATALIVGNKLFTAGTIGTLLALDKDSGKVVWSQELWKTWKGSPRVRGYACSPLAYRESVIVCVGGTGLAVMAFRQTDGSLLWKSQDFKPSPSSPILIKVGGQDQLIVFMAEEIAGLDPQNGKLLWNHPHITRYGLNVSTPVWGEDGLLFCSSAYDGGSRALRLTPKNGEPLVSELWFHRRMRIHFGNAVRIGDVVYGSSGDFGPTFFTAADIKTGEIAWQDRTFPHASFLWADGKFIILDENGRLSMAVASPKGLMVLAKVDLLSHPAWTVPTLVGTRLFLRDRKVMMALELATNKTSRGDVH